MNTRFLKPFFALLLGGSAALAPSALAANNTFSYQGKLIDDCCPANGYYDMRFKLLPSTTGSTAVSGTVTLAYPAVLVTNGLFTVSLNFGTGSEVFDGNARWLEIEVRTNNAPDGYVRLTPPTELTATPQAVYAQKAASVINNSVTAQSIASGQVVKSVNGLKDHVNLVAGANVTLTPNGSSLEISAGGGNPGWGLTGTAGTTPGVNFLGTTDGKPLELRAPFTGVNRTARITGAEYFGVRAPVSAGYGGMYVETAGATGLPFYGYAVNGGARAWHYLDGADGYKWKLYVGGDRLTVTPGGLVGIGTINPAYALDVAGPINASEGIVASSAYTGSYGTVLTVPYYSRKRLLSSFWRGGVGDYVDIEVPGNDGPGNLLRITSYGNVGIGVADPGHRLDVGGRVRVRGEGGQTPGLWMNAAHPTAGTADIGFMGVVDGTRMGFWGNDPRGVLGWGFTFDTLTGNVGIGTGTSYPTDKLHVNGSVRVASLTITGGADLAEPFQMSEEEIPEGSVVIIDEENPGHLKQATHAYDTRVAGIVSGANGVKAGIALHQEGVLEGGQNVALTGRVYVRADASFGAIKPGDLLTTSDTPGHAMKVTDSSKAQGAILGKAMTKLADGQGMVLVLVSLQ